METTQEQTEQLYRITERLKEIYPELSEYKIELKYSNLADNVYGQIGYVIKPGKLDALQSLKNAKPIFKTYVLCEISITFHKKLLNLKGAVRKDVLFYIGSHELTHFLELPKNLTSQELGINFNAHSQEFYKTHLERYNKFKKSRNEEPIEDMKEFDKVISSIVHDAIDEKKIEGQVINKKWQNEQ